MGKGDKRTKRGKIYRGTYGKARRPANKPKKERLCPPMPAAAPQPTEANAGTEAK